MKYIFVTGGVVSSLGKGLAAASIGTLLEHRGLTTLMQKFDPYLNVDPGTMSPFQHGEVYVLDDGAETDLDLGHYERFTSGVLSRMNNLTSGQVFDSVIKKERRGEFLGKTVQFIPHVTDEIKLRMHKVTEDNPDTDVLITEIGGTVGDMEGLLFIEALRQFALEVGKENVCFIHVTLLPYIKAAGEVKTKPTQQSVAKLRELGIQPDIIICRTEADLDEDNRKKIAMFCNVERKNVVAFRDVAHSIYECPLDLRRDKIDRLVVDKLGLGHTPSPALEDWERFVQRVIHPKHKVTIAVAGKYIELQDAYKSIYESLIHAGAHHDTKVQHRPCRSGSHRRPRREGRHRRCRRHPGPRRIRRPRDRRENSSSQVRAGEQDPVFRHLPRHADRDHRIRPQRLRAEGGEFHRVRQGDQASGHLLAGRAERRRGHGRDHASRFLRIHPLHRHQGRRSLRKRGPHPRAPPPPV